MQSVSLGDLRTRIAARADLPVLSATTFITKDEMGSWINQSGQRLMALLIDAYGEGHFATTQDITTTIDQDYTVMPFNTAAVATDIFRVLFLRTTLDGNRIQMVRAESEFIDTEDPNNQFAWTLAYPPRWTFREYTDQRFLWSRTPKAVHTVKVHYVPYFLFLNYQSEPSVVATMTDDDDHRMRSHLGWEEWVVLDCAIKALKRQGMDEWQALKLEQNDLAKDIKAEAPKRTDQAKRVRRQFFRDDQVRRGARHGLSW